MALCWNEIKDRAVKFSKEWKDDFNENAEAKSFMDEFFNVFGIPRRRVAYFETHVKKEGGKQGFIDLIWKGVILIEFKSRGKDLDKAHKQAKDYFPGLKDAELPKYILVSDFARFRLYDLEEDTMLEFKIEDLVKNIQHFGFIAGYQKQIYKEQDPVNVKAAELMSKLHDRLEEIGYEGHNLEVYLVRILFCLFAEDTTIFNKQIFQNYIEERTNADGSDLAARLQELFQVLNTPKEKRYKNIDEQLSEFPYVNGKLFEEPLHIASFDTKMRQALLECCYLDWSKISPAIFGSMFQSVMNPKERRNLGAHYTSEKNILKLIRPLFLDELWQEFENIKSNRNKLAEFHKKLSTLKFLDPACGCGNFLVITYRELRLLELEILREQYKNQLATSIESIVWLDVDMMYGIEYEEFPARIAEVAMWLMDHQMNMQISNEFGQYFARLPLKKAATIVHGNALRTDWQSLIQEEELAFNEANFFSKKKNSPPAGETPKGSKNFSYIIGNPPFYGSRNQTLNQKEDTNIVFNNVENIGVLDYVACWYYKAACYIKDTKIKVGFVSTNSICQGIQASILWQLLLKKANVVIHFAHQNFIWSNEARNNAGVYCVIIGFANYNIAKKILFEYSDIKGNPTERIVDHINVYLLDAKDIFVAPKTKPFISLPSMMKGNAAIDDGNFILGTEKQFEDFITRYPKSGKFVRKFIGSDELINNYSRYCLWLKEVKPFELNNNPEIKRRIENIQIFRSTSKKAATRKWAAYPTLFMEDRQPQSDYLMIPVVSSEIRKYIQLDTCQKI